MVCYNNFNIKRSGYKTGNDFIAEPADALSEEILAAEAKKDGNDSLLMKEYAVVIPLDRFLSLIIGNSPIRLGHFRQ